MQWNPPLVYSRPGQFFKIKITQTSQLSLGQNVSVHQFWHHPGISYVTRAILAHLALKCLLLELFGSVKLAKMLPKIGAQSHFDPNFTVEL